MHSGSSSIKKNFPQPSGCTLELRSTKTTSLETPGPSELLITLLPREEEYPLGAVARLMPLTARCFCLHGQIGMVDAPEYAGGELSNQSTLKFWTWWWAGSSVCSGRRHLPTRGWQAEGYLGTSEPDGQRCLSGTRPAACACLRFAIPASSSASIGWQ